MSISLVVSPAAWRDLGNYAAAMGVQTRAERFINGAKASFEFLQENPSAGALYLLDDPDIPALRKWYVRGFAKYLVFYRDEGKVIRIVRVIHGARDIPSLLRRMKGT